MTWRIARRQPLLNTYPASLTGDNRGRRLTVTVEMTRGFHGVATAGAASSAAARCPAIPAPCA